MWSSVGVPLLVLGRGIAFPAGLEPRRENDVGTVTGGGGSKYLREFQPLCSVKMKVKLLAESNGEGGEVRAQNDVKDSQQP